MKEELLKLLESFETCDNEEFFRYIPYHKYEELAEKLQEYIENKEESAFKAGSELNELTITTKYPTFKDYKSGKKN